MCAERPGLREAIRDEEHLHHVMDSLAVSYIPGGCCCSTGAAMTTFHDQAILADPARGDGHDAEGRAGDCLRAAAASLLGVEPEQLSHYAELPTDQWWDTMQAEAVALGYEWHFADRETWPGWQIPAGRLLIGSGPSPRGDFYHCVIIRPDETMVHDPHPSRAGLLSVEEFFILLTPADLEQPRQPILALSAGQVDKP